MNPWDSETWVRFEEFCGVSIVNRSLCRTLPPSLFLSESIQVLNSNGELLASEGYLLRERGGQNGDVLLNPWSESTGSFRELVVIGLGMEMLLWL